MYKQEPKYKCSYCGTLHSEYNTFCYRCMKGKLLEIDPDKQRKSIQRIKEYNREVFDKLNNEKENIEKQIKHLTKRLESINNEIEAVSERYEFYKLGVSQGVFYTCTVKSIDSYFVHLVIDVGVPELITYGILELDETNKEYIIGERVKLKVKEMFNSEVVKLSEK